MTTEPPEILSLREACTMAGKSERTLRRWLAEGTLTDLRPPGSGNAPCRIRTAELRAALAGKPEPLPAAGAGKGARPDSPGGVADRRREGGQALALALGQAEELRADKGRLLAELEQARLELARERAEVDRLRVALEEERRARAAVEREAARAAAEASTARQAAATAQEQARQAAAGGGVVRGLLRGLASRLAA